MIFCLNRSSLVACSFVTPTHLAKSLVLSFALLLAGFLPAHASPQRLLDEEIVVAAHNWHSRSFKLGVPSPVQLTIQGVRNTDKGFTIYLVSPAEFDHFQRGESFHYVGAFSGIKVRSLNQTALLSAGDWVFIVQNSENIYRDMVTHVRITVDP